MAALRLLWSFLGGVCLLVVILLWHVVAGLVGFWFLGVPGAVQIAFSVVLLIASLEHTIGMGPLCQVLEAIGAGLEACWPWRKAGYDD